MAYSALAVSNYFIKKALSGGDKSVTPMKLQKLVYIAHGWYLALTDGDSPEPLIDEVVEAWPYGPVIKGIYHTFSRYGSNAITSTEKGIFGDEEIVKNKGDTAFLDKIWSEYKGYTAYQLSEMTHRNGTPWFEAFNKNKQQEISNEIIFKHYKDKLNG